jgi:hypothetical protein
MFADRAGWTGANGEGSFMSRITIALALIVAASAGATQRLRGQDAPLPAGSNPCAQPLEEIAGAYTVDSLLLALDPGYGIKPVDSTSALTTLSVINDHLTLPAPLALPPVVVGWGPNPKGSGKAAIQGFMGEAFVEIDRHGKVKRTGLTQTTLVSSLDAALVAAVQQAANDGAFMAYQDNAHEHGGYVFVQLRTMPLPAFNQKAEDYKRPESGALVPLPYSNEPTIKKKGDAVTLPIRLLHVPFVSLTSPIEITKRGPDPVFPSTELDGRQDGFVNIEFVVGADGVAIPGTLRLANAMTAGYAKAVISAMKDYRFKPAMAGSCPVASRETYTFTFNVY